MSDLQEAKFWKGVLFILFCFRFLCVLQVLKKCFTKFSPEIYQELLDTTLKFTFISFVGNSVTKITIESTSLTMKYISQENDNFKSHICVSHLTRLWFLVNSWIHEPNAKTKGSWTLNSLCKKVHFNFILLSVSKFLANWAIGRVQTNLQVIHLSAIAKLFQVRI